MIGLAAALLGGANVQPAETRDWGIFFGLDFFIVNLLVTGFMFAPLERAFPHRRTQRLFRTEWREDLFYYMVSTMFVRSEEHTSELQSLMRSSSAVFCLKKKNKEQLIIHNYT